MIKSGALKEWKARGQGFRRRGLCVVFGDGSAEEKTVLQRHCPENC